MEKQTFQLFNRSTIQRVKACAFTLAETLIVIGIIGVVAALTLPNLNHATGDKEKVTRVKKIYSALTDAVDRAQVIYGDYDTWFNDLSNEDTAGKAERFAKRVTEFMKVSKDCGFDEGCWSTAPLLLVDGSEYEDNYFNAFNGTVYMVNLSDGMSLGFCGYDGRVRVDIDGPNKGKTQEGNDIFDFTILSENMINWASSEKGVNCGSKNSLITSPYCQSLIEGDFLTDCASSNVTAWVVENGNLDYLKCADQLNWENQTSCK